MKSRSTTTPGPNPGRTGALRPGNLFGGYRIVRLLGAGAMGVVYEAVQLSLDRPVALKLLAPDLAVDAEPRARFLQEGRLAARAVHPHLVRVLDVAEVEGRLMLAHELVMGDTLGQRLEQEGALAIELALEVTATAAEVLAALHKMGILHRDIKPANLFLSSDRGVLVGDLGLAKDLLSAGPLTRKGLMLGTPFYMAPEVWRGEAATPAVDLYALGVTFFQLVTGRPPFDSEDPAELFRLHVSAPIPAASLARPELPGAYDSLFRTALAKNPTERFPDAAAFLRAVQALPSVRTLPQPSEPTRALASGARSAKRSSNHARRPLASTRVSSAEQPRKRGVLPAVLLAAGLALVAVALLPRPPRPNPAPPKAAPAAHPLRKAPARPAAWMAAPTLPGDEAVPTLARAQQRLRDVREAVERLHAKERNKNSGDPRALLARTLALWKESLEGQGAAFDDLKARIVSQDAAARAQLSRLMGSLLLTAWDILDCFGYTLRLWASRETGLLAYAHSMDGVLLMQRMAEAALPLYERVSPLLAGFSEPASRGGAACMRALVEGALPRDRTRTPPSELVRDALFAVLREGRGLDLMIVRGLARAVRASRDARDATDVLDAALRGPGDSAADPVRELARFDLAVQRVWASREVVVGDGPDAVEELDRQQKAWTAARDRLFSKWPYDLQTPPSTGTGLAFELHPDARARLSEAAGWIANTARALKKRVPQPPRRP
ncbi:MAG: serine/threonine protein kinase [Candidatus Wallbacteria bacterium]|nr:serine/threonine protein kinase [Candidatus Wallbacteria bacterium]